MNDLPASTDGVPSLALQKEFWNEWNLSFLASAKRDSFQLQQRETAHAAAARAAAAVPGGAGRSAIGAVGGRPAAVIADNSRVPGLRPADRGSTAAARVRTIDAAVTCSAATTASSALILPVRPGIVWVAHASSLVGYAVTGDQRPRGNSRYPAAGVLPAR